MLTVWGSFSPPWWGRHWQQEQGLGVSHDNLTKKQRVKPETKLGGTTPQNLPPVIHLCHPGLNLLNIVEPPLTSVTSWGLLLKELFVTSPLYYEIFRHAFSVVWDVSPRKQGLFKVSIRSHTWDWKSSPHRQCIFKVI